MPNMADAFYLRRGGVFNPSGNFASVNPENNSPTPVGPFRPITASAPGGAHQTFLRGQIFQDRNVPSGHMIAERSRRTKIHTELLK